MSNALGLGFHLLRVPSSSASRRNNTEKNERILEENSTPSNLRLLCIPMQCVHRRLRCSTSKFTKRNFLLPEVHRGAVHPGGDTRYCWEHIFKRSLACNRRKSCF